jgi:hypothetical protein
MASDDALTIKIYSVVFLIFVLIISIIITYFTFLLTQQMDQFSDKQSVTKSISAIASWSVGLIAILFLIIFVAVLAYLFTPYIVVLFLALYILVMIALFVYTSIVLNAVRTSSDYQKYVNGCPPNDQNCFKLTQNVQSAINSIIVILVLSMVAIVSMIIFLVYLIRSLSLKTELETVFSRFKGEEREKEVLYSPKEYKRQIEESIFQDPEYQKYLTQKSALQTRPNLIVKQNQVKPTEEKKVNQTPNNKTKIEKLSENLEALSPEERKQVLNTPKLLKTIASLAPKKVQFDNKNTPNKYSKTPASPSTPVKTQFGVTTPLNRGFRSSNKKSSILKNK